MVIIVHVEYGTPTNLEVLRIALQDGFKVSSAIECRGTDRFSDCNVTTCIVYTLEKEQRVE